MRDIILNFPKQIPIGFEIGQKFKFNKKYPRTIICGMGGSAIPGQILELVAPGLNILINRNYSLPASANKNDLVVCVSWSGGTQETIDCCKEASKMGLETIVMTKGGRLSQCQGSTLTLMPNEQIPARMAVGYMTGALLGIFGIEANINLEPKKLENTGRDIASDIGDKIPVIYATHKWYPLAEFWSNIILEDAKITSFWNYFPVLAHNEICAYADPQKRVHPIIIKDNEDSGPVLADISAAIAIFKEREYNYSIVDLSESAQALEKIFSNYILALWTGFYLAKNLGVDPLETSLIDKFKSLKK